MTTPEELERAKKLLTSLKNAANKPLLDSRHQTNSVRLLVDEKIRPSLFQPHPTLPNVYYANSLTIRAVKKDLFLGGEGFEDLEDLTECLSCNSKIDRQFWHFCPFCEGKLVT
tara:strand:+ start:94 stop:432 length:339 start_codon:yes stop_codon:yes gene_type:complete